MIRLNELNERHHCGTDGYGGPQDGCAKDTYHINGIPAKNAFPKSSHEKNIRDTQNKGHSTLQNSCPIIFKSVKVMKVKIRQELFEMEGHMTTICNI